MTQRVSASGRKALAAREGKRLKAYRDSVGVWTIGIGHTSMAGPPVVTPDLVITDAECDAIFTRDLAKYEAAVASVLTRPVSQTSFDALVSFCYNIGPAGFAGSTVVKRINAGDPKGAAVAFMLWNKPPEIKGRRESEQKQFLAGLDEALSAPPEPVAPPLRRGSTGNAVRILQRNLKLAGFYRAAVDGDFGGQTESAVKAFQRSAGLAADGIAGKLTLAALNKET